MSLLTTQQITQAGLKPILSVASPDGDSVVNTGRQYFYIKNCSTEPYGDITCTVNPVVTTVNDPLLGVLVKKPAVITLSPLEYGFLGPFEINAFNNVQGTISINYSDATYVMLAVLYI
jgi:hypothetical protein